MQNYNELIKLTEVLTKQDEALSLKATKAESARIRKTLMAMKKLITPAKQDLLNADKG